MLHILSFCSVYYAQYRYTQLSGGSDNFSGVPAAFLVTCLNVIMFSISAPDLSWAATDLWLRLSLPMINITDWLLKKNCMPHSLRITDLYRCLKSLHKDPRNTIICQMSVFTWWQLQAPFSPLVAPVNAVSILGLRT